MNDHTHHPLTHRPPSPLPGEPPRLAERLWLRRYARRRFHRFEDLLPGEELESLADLGFVLATRRYQPDREASFGTYARWWVEGLLRRAVRRALAQEEERRSAGAPSADADAHARRPLTPETLAWLRRTLERLSPRDREIIVATVVEGRSARSLAPSLGVSPRQAQRLVRRAVGRLQEAAGVEDDDARGPGLTPRVGPPSAGSAMAAGVAG